MVRDFNDRADAGKRLAEELSGYKSSGAVVLALPRGGVVVGFEVAQALNAPLSVIVPRKIGAPGEPELAIGAVTEDGESILDHSLIVSLGVDASYIESQKRFEVEEIKRRMRVYLGDRPRPVLKGRVVIVVDDGVATGATMKAAVRSIRHQDPAKVIIAIPVAPPNAAEELKNYADEVVCLSTPHAFYAIGQFYLDFTQVSDEEVISLLQRSNP